MDTKGHEEKEKTNTDLLHHRGTPRNTENISLVEKTTSILALSFFRHGFLRHGSTGSPLVLRMGNTD
jgi:hypothetical protein